MTNPELLQLLLQKVTCTETRLDKTETKNEAEISLLKRAK